MADENIRLMMSEAAVQENLFLEKLFSARFHDKTVFRIDPDGIEFVKALRPRWNLQAFRRSIDRRHRNASLPFAPMVPFNRGLHIRLKVIGRDAEPGGFADVQ